MYAAKMSSILIAIVNYCTAELTVDCLRSLSSQVNDLANIRVIVVDNNSEDGSVVKLSTAIEHEGWSSWASMMGPARNHGRGNRGLGNRKAAQSLALEMRDEKESA